LNLPFERGESKRNQAHGKEFPR